MNSPVGITVRLAILGTVIVGMPLLAVPQVRDRLGRVWSHSADRWTGVADAEMEEEEEDGDELPRILAPTGSSDAAAVPDRDASSLPPDEAPLAVLLPVAEADDEPPPQRHWQLPPPVAERLATLGAGYLVVEQLEHSGLYRCLCLVDVPGTAFQRPFEAEDLEPERALARVLEEVEHWALPRRPALTASRHPHAAP